MTLAVFSPFETSRLTYTCNYLFHELMGLDVNVYSDEALFLKAEADAFVCYRREAFAGMSTIQIIPTGLLFENSVADIEVRAGSWNDVPTIFPNEGDIPCDVLAASFYMLSRYEEYLPHHRDEHDRFNPEQSIAMKLGFLRRPIIEEWAILLGKQLCSVFPNLELSRPKYEFHATVDVDNAYAYKEKGIVRTAGALLREAVKFKFSELRKRFQTIYGNLKDPFDTFDELIRIHKTHQVPTRFFFLVADYGHNDKNVPITSTAFRSLIKSVNDYCDVGIHPGYNAHLNRQLLKVELERLEETIHMPVTHSRFHFLRLSLPKSYHLLLDAEIDHDYSMGYPSELGFRAGTSRPFYFYDLDRETITKLRVHPFCIMEATVKYYYNQGPLEALSVFKELVDRVKAVDGIAVALWHNDSLSEVAPWKGWGKLYGQLVDYARPQ